MLFGVTLAHIEETLAGREVSEEEGDCRLVLSTLLNVLAGWLVSYAINFRLEKVIITSRSVRLNCANWAHTCVLLVNSGPFR